MNIYSIPDFVYSDCSCLGGCLFAASPFYFMDSGTIQAEKLLFYNNGG